MRALETAIPVCYMRPFTKSSLGTLPATFVPKVPPDAEIHVELKAFRDKVYAHTDKASGRRATMNVESVSPETGHVTLAYREQWTPLDRATLPALSAFFERQRDHFRREAGHLQLQLDRLGP